MLQYTIVYSYGFGKKTKVFDLSLDTTESIARAKFTGLSTHGTGNRALYLNWRPVAWFGAFPEDTIPDCNADPCIFAGNIPAHTPIGGLAPIGVAWPGRAIRRGELRPEKGCPRSEWLPVTASIDGVPVRIVKPGEINAPLYGLAGNRAC